MFVQEELARPLRLDGLYVGCPPGQRGRVAPLAPMAAPLGRRLGLRPGAVMGGPIGRIPALLGLPVSPRRFVNALLPRGIEDVLWGPEVMDAEIPTANGFFTARSLAKLYALLAHGGQAGGVRLLSPRTVQQIAVVHSTRARSRPGPADGLAAGIPQRLHHTRHGARRVRSLRLRRLGRVGRSAA